MPSVVSEKESPAWKNPREVIRKHMKRKSSRCLLPPTLSSPALLLSERDENKAAFSAASSSSGGPRRNPFKRSSPRKRRRFAEKLDEAKENVPEGVVIWDSENALHGFPSSSFEKICEEGKFEKDPASAFAATDFSDLDQKYSSTPKGVVPKLEEIEERKVMKNLPIDLRLGSKIRIESAKPFPWMNSPNVPGGYHVRVTGADLDSGVRLFCGCEHNLSKEGSSKQISPMAYLEASSMFWQFPDIPWMQMFPRLDSHSRLIASREAKAPSLQAISTTFVSALSAQWTRAFDQLFYSWKKGTRHSFYLCCSSFTALFIKDPNSTTAVVDDESNSTSLGATPVPLRVVITPTTVGLRQQLREEGIAYEMPFRQSNSRRTSRDSAEFEDNGNTNTFDVTQSQPPILGRREPSNTEGPVVFCGGDSDEDESPSKHNTSNESDNATWLKDIGFSPVSAFKLTRQSSVSSFSNRSGSSVDSGLNGSRSSLNDDGRKSAVVVTDPASIQALFNLINTSRICRPMTGPQAGLPPTLLALQPFLLSTLKSLSKSSQILKKGDNEMKYICELSDGPIMPHMFPLLVEFFTSSSSLNVAGNRLKVHVAGRPSCPGMNQAVDSQGLDDFFVFEYSPSEGLYYL